MGVRKMAKRVTGDDVAEAVSVLTKYNDGNLVEVVRCKDCKYLRRLRNHEPYVFCGNPVNGLWHIWSGDDFCSYGERETDV